MNSRRVFTIAALVALHAIAGSAEPRYRWTAQQTIDRLFHGAFQMLVPVVASAASSASGWTPTFVTADSCNGSGLNCNVAGLVVNSGDVIVCGVASTSVPTNTLSCTSAAVSSWSSPTSNPYLDSGTMISGFFMGTSTTTGTITVTPTVTNQANFMGGAVAVYRGTPSSGWDQAIAGAHNAATTSHVTGTTGAVGVASLAVSLFSTTAGATFTGTNSWNCRTTSGGSPAVGICDKNVTSGTQQGTATTVAALTGSGAAATIK